MIWIAIAIFIVCVSLLRATGGQRCGPDEFGELVKTGDAGDETIMCLSLEIERVDWEIAQERCAWKNGWLVTINSSIENMLVFNMAWMRDKRYTAWIGLNALKKQGDFRWIEFADQETNLSKPVYTKWGRGEPNSLRTEKCTEMNWLAQWNNFPCQSTSSRYPKYVCQYEIEQGQIIEYPACPDGGRMYMFRGVWKCLEYNSDPVTFLTAKAACENKNAWLVNIKNDEEADLVNLYTPLNSYYWLGLRLNGTTHERKKWLWSRDSSEAEYTNWAGRHPNKDARNIYGAIFNMIRSDSYGGQWFNTVGTQKYRYICEWDYYLPSGQPTSQPTTQPSVPTSSPSSQPSIPTSVPTNEPSAQPSCQPTSSPSSYNKRQCQYDSECVMQNSECFSNECVCSSGYYYIYETGGSCEQVPAGYRPLKRLPFRPPSEKYRKVFASRDFRRIVALTDKGTLYLTDDYGASFYFRQGPGGSKNLRALVASDDLKLIITASCDEAGRTYFSSDGGMSWFDFSYDSKLPKGIDGFSTPDVDMKRIYATYHGSANIWKSDDDGRVASWSLFSTANIPDVSDSVVSSDGNLAVICGVRGHIAFYNASANPKWKTLLYKGSNYHFIDITSDSTFTYFAAVAHYYRPCRACTSTLRNILMSSDQGKTWKEVGPKRDWRGIHASPDFMNIVATSWTGMWLSVDRGQTWKNSTTATIPEVVTKIGGTKIVICLPGTYSLAGSFDCSPCKPGFYADKSGSSSCTPCPAGKYSLTEGSKALSNCIDCKKGYFGNETGSTECLPCPEGSYQYREGTRFCWKCAPGRYSDSLSATDPASCRPCELGSNTSYAGSNECLLCPGGHYTDSVATIQCLSCPGGKYAKYTKGRSFDDCLTCLAGTYANNGSSICIDTPPGTFTTAGASAPEPCPIGTYASREGKADSCSLCPISTFADGNGSEYCQACEFGRLTPFTGATDELLCVDPEANFITAIVTFILVVLGSYEYVMKGRFQAVGFIRRERVFKPLTKETLGLAVYLYRYIYKAEAQRVYLTAKNIVRVSVWLFLGTVITILTAVLLIIGGFIRIIFKAMIVVVGLKMDVPFISTLRSFVEALLTILYFPWIREYIFSPLMYVITFLSQFKIDLEMINITCAGSTAPLKLFVNVCIIGVIIIIVEADFSFLDSVTVQALTAKFYRIVASISYIPWSPVTFARFQGALRNADANKHAGILRRSLAKCSDVYKAIFPPTAFLFSFNYIGVLLVSASTGLLQGTDIFQTILQYLASRVILSDFFDIAYVFHTWDNNCNTVPGFYYFDTIIAVLTSLLFLFLLMPTMYLISAIFIPGIPKNIDVEVFKMDDTDTAEVRPGHAEGGNTEQLKRWQRYYRDLWKFLSVLAPDLWWAETTRGWVAFISRNTPYDTGKVAPSIHQVQSIAVEEDVTENRPVDNSDEGGHLSARLPHVIRSAQTVALMKKLEAPENFTFRLKVFIDYDNGDSNDKIDDTDRGGAADKDRAPNEGNTPTSIFIERSIDDDAEGEGDTPGTDLDTKADNEGNEGDISYIDIERRLDNDDDEGPAIDISEVDLETRIQRLFNGQNDNEETKKEDTQHAKLRLCLYRCDRTIGETKVWTEIEVEQFSGDGYFTFVKIEAQSGKVLLVRTYGNWLIEDTSQVEALVKDIESCLPTHVIVLVKWGNHSQTIDRMIEESFLVSTKSEMYLPAEVVNVMHLNRPATARKQRQGSIVAGYARRDSIPDALMLTKEEEESPVKTRRASLSKKTATRGRRRSSAGSASFTQINRDVSTEDKRRYIDVLKDDALKGSSGTALFDLAEAIATCHGDATTLPDTQAHFLIGLPIHSDYGSGRNGGNLQTNSTGGYMRWVANSGLAYTKVNDIIEDQTWRYANLADDDVLLDGTFTVGFVEFEDGVNEKGGRKRRRKRRNDGIAKWTVEEDPSIGYPPFLCIPASSYVQAPLRRSTDDEVNAWHARQSRNLPSYDRLCALEYEELVSWFAAQEGDAKGTNMHCCGRNCSLSDGCCSCPRLKFPYFLERIASYIGTIFCIFGIGHLLTRVGRKAFYIVFWKYFRFLLLCLGYWDDELVELYAVHEKLLHSSIVWMHPFFRQSREIKKAVSIPPPPPPNGSKPPPPPPPPSAPPLDNSSQDDAENAVSPSSLGSVWLFLTSSAERGRVFAETFHHLEETKNVQKLSETTLKQMYSEDYSSGLRSIVATRSIIWQLIPGAALLNIFSEMTSIAPLFVFSRDLELSLPELICRNPFKVARDIETEFTDAANRIRKTELNEDDYVVPVAELELIGSLERGRVERSNERVRKKMKRCLAQPPLKVKEWAVRIIGCQQFIEGSRLIKFFQEASQFGLIVWLLFGDSSAGHELFLIVAFAVLVPPAILRALSIYVALGKALAITDDDLQAWFSSISKLFGGGRSTAYPVDKDEHELTSMDEVERGKVDLFVDPDSYMENPMMLERDDGDGDGNDNGDDDSSEGSEEEEEVAFDYGAVYRIDEQESESVTMSINPMLMMGRIKEERECNQEEQTNDERGSSSHMSEENHKQSQEEQTNNEEGSSSSHLQEEHTQDVGAHLEDKQEQPNNEQLLPSESRASVETEESEESEEEDKVWREGDNDDFTISLEEI